MCKIRHFFQHAKHYLILNTTDIITNLINLMKVTGERLILSQAKSKQKSCFTRMNLKNTQLMWGNEVLLFTNVCIAAFDFSLIFLTY